MIWDAEATFAMTTSIVTFRVVHRIILSFFTFVLIDSLLSLTFELLTQKELFCMPSLPRIRGLCWD